jgi:hypothetical protein
VSYSPSSSSPKTRKTTTFNTETTPKTTLLFGWWVTCLHDFPEDEGIVLLPLKPAPKPGDKIKLPSNGEIWEVHSVNPEEVKITVVPLKEQPLAG